MNKKKMFSNFIWRLMERVGAQSVTLIVTMILARLIEPSAFGIAAIVLIFVSLSNIFIDSGFGVALVQKKDADDLDFSTVFFFNIVICIALYTTIFLCAPIIAHFYSIPELTALLRVQCITILVSGIKSIQIAYVSRKMLFKKFFFSTLGGTVGAAVLGIWMAYNNYGVWALVAQNLFNNVIDTLILWVTVKWRPQKQFSLDRLKSLFSFGSKLLISNLMYASYSDLRQLIIGKIYTTNDLAFYNRGSKLPEVVNGSISSSLASILFPVMSQAQDSREQIKAMIRRTILVYSYILTPAFIGMFVCAKQIIIVLFSERWLPAVPYLRILSLTYLFECLGVANQNATKALGRSDITLKIECIKTPLFLIILLLTVKHSIMMIAFGVVGGIWAAEFLCAYPSKKTVGYSVFQQLHDIMPHLLLATAMGICVWLISYLPLNVFLLLCLQVLAGVFIYLLGSQIFRLDTFYYVLNYVKPLLIKLFHKSIPS